MSSLVTFTGLSVRTDFEDGLPRVRDLDVASELELANVYDIRTLVQKHAEDLNDFGFLAATDNRDALGRGRKRKDGVESGTTYWLNKDQALFIVGRSTTAKGRETYKLLVKTFSAVMKVRELSSKSQSQVAMAVDAAHSILLRAGVREGIAAAAVLAVVEQHTGVQLEQARLALPADATPSERLNPTKLGEELGVTARQVNLRLEAAGLQTKGDRDPWMLTDAGKRYGEAVPYANGKHAGNQLLWSRDVLEVIR
jgi:hypothetical protein